MLGLDHHGLISDTTAKIHIKEDAKSKFFRAQTIPYAFNDRAIQEIDRLEKAGIIVKLDPIVPVVKLDIGETLWGLQGDCEQSRKGR